MQWIKVTVSNGIFHSNLYIFVNHLLLGVKFYLIFLQRQFSLSLGVLFIPVYSQVQHSACHPLSNTWYLLLAQSDWYHLYLIHKTLDLSLSSGPAVQRNLWRPQHVLSSPGLQDSKHSVYLFVHKCSSRFICSVQS